MNELYEIASKANTIFVFYFFIALFVNGIIFAVKDIVKWIIKKIKAHKEKKTVSED